MNGLFRLLSLCLLVALRLAGQESRTLPSDALRHPGWNFSIGIEGGVPLLKTPWIPGAPSRNAFNVGTTIRWGRVLTAEHGEHWLRGTLELGFTLIPVNVYFDGGQQYYTGGTELVCPRWNFTEHRKRFVPFAGVAGGMLFGPEKFPPGNTSQANFTVAFESGAHVFRSKKRSYEVTTRLFHISNAGIGKYNPGVPLSVQLGFGYTWY